MDKTEVKKEVAQFLSEQTTAAVSTVSIDGEPQVATMYFYTDEELTFYFVTARDSRKLKNIERSGKVALVVGFGPAPITVQASGVAEIIDSEFKDEYVSKFLEKIKFRNLDHWPVLQLEKDGLIVFKIKPKRLVFLNLDKEGHPKTYSHEFHTIIPQE